MQKIVSGFEEEENCEDCECDYCEDEEYSAL